MKKVTAWKEARGATWQRGGGDRDETFDLLSVEGHVESRREVSVDEGEKDVEEEEEIHDRCLCSPANRSRRRRRGA